MSNTTAIWLLWAVAMLLTLTGVEIVDNAPHATGEELLGYAFVGFGLLGMILTGQRMRP